MAFFSISLQLLLYELDLKFENTSCIENNPEFAYPELYMPGSDPQPDSLVIGTLSEILPIAASYPDATFLCIRDRFSDELENMANMQQIVVLLTNLKVPEVFNRVLRVFRKLQKWDTDMRISAASNQGMQHLLDLSEPVIGNHIDIMDATFKLLGYTRNIPLDDPITRDLIANGYHSENTVNELRKNRRFEEYETKDDIIVSDDFKLCKYVTLKRIFHLNGKPILYVVMHCNHRNADGGLTDLFQMLLNHIVSYINKDFLYPAAFAASQQYLSDLLDGNIKSVDEAISRASYATIPFQQDYQLYLIAFDNNFNTPLDNLAANINKKLPFSYVISYYRRIVILHSYSEKKDNAKNVCSVLLKVLCHFPCIVGISNPISNLWETRAALEQAGCAIEYGSHICHGRSTETEDSKGIFFYNFEQCFLTLMVAKSFNSSPEIFRNSFMIQAMHTLLKYDKQHHTHLFTTLKVYLQCNRKATETGDILHMHRNTVLYHIDRIEQLLHISLSSADVCLKLQLGIKTFESNMSEILL